MRVKKALKRSLQNCYPFQKPHKGRTSTSSQSDKSLDPRIGAAFTPQLSSPSPNDFSDSIGNHTIMSTPHDSVVSTPDSNQNMVENRRQPPTEMDIATPRLPRPGYMKPTRSSIARTVTKISSSNSQQSLVDKRRQPHHELDISSHQSPGYMKPTRSSLARSVTNLSYSNSQPNLVENRRQPFIDLDISPPQSPSPGYMKPTRSSLNRALSSRRSNSGPSLPQQTDTSNSTSHLNVSFTDNTPETKTEEVKQIRRSSNSATTPCLRRSARNRIAPVRYYLGEHARYKYDENGLATLVGIYEVKEPEAQGRSRAALKKHKSKKRQRKSKKKMDA